VNLGSIVSLGVGIALGLFLAKAIGAK